MVFDLQPFAQFGNDGGVFALESLYRKKRFILLGIQGSAFAEKIFAETQKLSQQVTKLGEVLEIFGIKARHAKNLGIGSEFKYRTSIQWHDDCSFLYIYMNTPKANSYSGFTLVEIMIVV